MSRSSYSSDASRKSTSFSFGGTPHPICLPVLAAASGAVDDALFEDAFNTTPALSVRTSAARETKTDGKVYPFPLAFIGQRSGKSTEQYSRYFGRRQQRLGEACRCSQ